MKAGRRPLVPVRDDVRRTLVWTPDASRALAALGNAPDVYGQTWHLPVDESRPTYQDLVAMVAQEFGTDGKYTVVPKWALRAAGAVSPRAWEIRELLPRYANDDLFDATKFRVRFPDFRVTAFREGLAIIHGEARA